MPYFSLQVAHLHRPKFDTLRLVMENSRLPTVMHLRDHVFVWDKKFESCRKEAYRVEESSLIQEPNQNAVAAFLRAQASRLEPPDHNYTALQTFFGAGT